MEDVSRSSYLLLGVLSCFELKEYRSEGKQKVEFVKRAEQACDSSLVIDSPLNQWLNATNHFHFF